MIYKINNKILFQDDDGSIWIEGDMELKYNLTVTASRLLAFLLKNQGKVLTREVILTRVWDNYGLRSSNNSLNKYIFDLRNVLRNLECEEDVILTLPRVGFKVSENINIESDIILNTEENHSTGLGEKLLDVIKTAPLKKTKNTLTIIIIAAGSAIIIFCIVFILVISFNKKIQFPEQSTYELTQVDGCNFMTFKTLPADVVDLIIHSAQKILSKHKMRCNKNNIIYIQVSEPVLYEHGGRVFISNCILNPISKTLTTCNNIYEVDYDIEK